MSTVEENDVRSLGLPSRARNALMGEGIYEISVLVTKTPKQLLRMVNLGRGSLGDIEEALRDRGLKLMPNTEKTFEQRRVEIEKLLSKAYSLQDELVKDVVATTSGGIKEEIRAIARVSNRVEAIRYYRQVHGTSLVESKKCVETILEEEEREKG